MLDIQRFSIESIPMLQCNVSIDEMGENETCETCEGPEDISPSDLQLSDALGLRGPAGNVNIGKLSARNFNLRPPGSTM